eukprot:CAMPEP_0201482814 /NCGR_PEP_ID=MMETSP0151_2-20130828/7063_1 /ASSEMBLY_ACC=CAM_ASM_000257 /TAXON_ID=200890 /ORGANISM="Paramoeba atlantica, Strain 621/1 / CCAP 1560/9" /LENGTH=967 /DNA_ID=CAMNT_0047865677 /DNA_START=47 /DNA_END=2950 /DNA_ORIENTATION=-
MAFELSPDELSNAFVQKEECFLLLEKLGGVEGLASRLRTDLKNGLSESEERENFETRRIHYGDNTYPEKPRKSWFALWWEAMQDTTLIILCIAAAVSLVIGIIVPEDEEEGGSWIEGLAILLAVLLVSCVTATNEYKQEGQFRELNKVKEDKEVKVIRGGRQREVRIAQIFVGDIVIIDCGDQIPSDGIIVQSDELTVDESVMTGEPDSLPKSPNGDYRMLSGCQCDAGMGRMLVVATGERSQWGITLKKLTDDRTETPLQKNLGEMAEMIGLAGLGVAVLVFGILMIYWFLDILGEDWEWNNLRDIIDFFIIAVTIVVVAVPEGLPLAVTISLAYSMKQMVKDNNLVRKMAACETMGGATDICSDKTGTLTENKMTLEAGWMAGEEFQVVPPNLRVETEVLHMIHESIAVNSSPSTRVEMAEDLPPKFIGNKTECALLVFSSHCGYDYEEIRRNTEVTKVYAFSSARKRMSCVVPSGVGHRLYCKGAPEIVLRDCVSVMRGDGEQIPLTEEMKGQLLEYVDSLAARGLRTLCLTCRSMPHFNPDVEVDPPEQELTVLAIVGIRDPIRKEVPDAVLKCQNAGVVVRMVTGDNIGTAKKIAEEAGILTEGGLALEGPKFAKMSDAEIDEAIPRLQVLARSLPMDKLRLVQRLMANKHVVGVTGDGTNDAPALKQADVGLAMGIAGTDVAKEASDIIILDDNFNSCVFSILWGRCIFDNIRKFLQFQLTVNFSALLVAFIGALSQRGSPLKAIQLLWVNLIMDTMAALALGTEKPHPDLLERPPININRAWLLSNIMIKNIIGQGIYQVVILCFIMFAGKYIWYVEDGSDIHYTYIFNSFVFAQVFNEINSRKCNGELNVFDKFFTNPIFVGVIAVTVFLQFLIITFGGVAFHCVPLDFEEWVITVLIGFGSMPLGLILRVIPVPVMDAWGFGETEQKLRSEAKIQRMRERHEARKKKKPEAYGEFRDE